MKNNNLTEKTKFTWNDLAESINKLSPEQRQNQVHIQIEDESTFRKVEDISDIEYDVYVHKTDNEDCGSLESLKEQHGTDFVESDYKLVTPKGYPFLWDGF